MSTGPTQPPAEFVRSAGVPSSYEQHREQREFREHQEYKKVQVEQQKQYDLQQMSMGIRDRIIQTYRQEIESHRLNEKDFSTLLQQIEDLKQRRNALEVSVDTLRGDYEA